MLFIKRREIILFLELIKKHSIPKECYQYMKKKELINFALIFIHNKIIMIKQENLFT